MGLGNPRISSRSIMIRSIGIINCSFLHDRPWISPWIKPIFNELDITCHVFASQLSGHCDVIANRLWRHQQNVKRASETRGWHANILVFIVIDGFVMSCKKWNNVCTTVTNCLCAHSSVILVLCFPRCCATREKNTKITLSRAHIQFATRVHTLFYKSFDDPGWQWTGRLRIPSV